MGFTSRPYRLDDPAFLALYVKRAALDPIELGLTASLLLIGVGLAGHRAPIAVLPLAVVAALLACRFWLRPSVSERLVTRTLKGGPRQAVFTNEGFRIQPVDSVQKSHAEMPWTRLDRVEREAGYLFLLPYPSSPRGFAIPEEALSPNELDQLLDLLRTRKLYEKSDQPKSAEDSAENPQNGERMQV